ncbi:MAG: PIN/TRAM domain-containing protein [Acidaminococcaceae bacterium]|nr:PIN/TRAM domain-containing protein [Acidaminococcaceae bacterium]MDD4721864.1 PIN/TRAM domain-containing protein [Acidaminococcaceae bacterium]
MLEKVLKITIVIVFAITGLILMELMTPYISGVVNYKFESSGIFGVTIATTLAGIFGVLCFGGVGYALAPALINKTMRFTELIAIVLAKMPTSYILVVAMGAIIGLVVANLLGAPFSHLPIIGSYIPLILSLIFAIVGAKVALRKRTDIISFFNRIPSLRIPRESTKKESAHLVSCNYKILDTSVLIDGRIVDIIKTGFLDGTIVITKFVLEELQKIADSSDTLKRNRGRRGLDVVKEIQANKLIKVQISEKDYDDITEVDAKLVRLCKEIGGAVATNDFNLSKVAEIQGVRILNINDLANAVKPAVLPGEEMKAFLAKEGKEQGQAIAYLDDGTMIVVENGKRYVNANVAVIVTSVLQTSAGRMIFAKMK